MQKQISAEELFWTINGQRGELIKGEFVEMSPSGGTHGKVAMKFGSNVLPGFSIPIKRIFS